MDSFLQILKSCGNIFECSYVIVDYTKDDRPLIYINDSFVELTGFSKEEILNKNCRFLQGQSTNQETISLLSNAIRNGESGWFDILNYKKDGTSFWNRLTLIPIGGEIDPVRYYLGIQQDVTLQKEQGLTNSESGSLKRAGKSLIAPLMNILNAHRSMKYFDLSNQNDQNKLNDLAYQAREQMREISGHVRNLS